MIIVEEPFEIGDGAQGAGVMHMRTLGCQEARWVEILPWRI
jgi:hypothetical protein